MFRPTFLMLFSFQITHKNVSVRYQLIIEYLLHEINFLKSWNPNNNGIQRLVQILEGSGYVLQVEKSSLSRSYRRWSVSPGCGAF